MLYLVALLKPVYPWLEYAIHQDYFAKVLCVNKDKPEMHCNGKCHLKKEIKKSTGENSNEQKPLPIDLREYPIGHVSALNVQFFKTNTRLFTRTYPLNEYSPFIPGLFRPPQA